MPSSANLGDYLEAFVTRLVERGRYRSRREVLREGVRLVEEKEKRLAILDTALARGIADADGLVPLDAVAERLKAKYEVARGDKV